MICVAHLAQPVGTSTAPFAVRSSGRQRDRSDVRSPRIVLPPTLLGDLGANDVLVDAPLARGPRSISSVVPVKLPVTRGSAELGVDPLVWLYCALEERIDVPEERGRHNQRR